MISTNKMYIFFTLKCGYGYNNDNINKVCAKFELTLFAE